MQIIIDFSIAWRTSVIDGSLHKFTQLYNDKIKSSRADVKISVHITNVFPSKKGAKGYQFPEKSLTIKKRANQISEMCISKRPLLQICKSVLHVLNDYFLHKQIIIHKAQTFSMSEKGSSSSNKLEIHWILFIILI